MVNPSPSRFFAVTLLLSLPLYLAYLLIWLGTLPSELGMGLIPLAVLAPLIAALVLTPRGQRRTLLGKAVDWKALPNRAWIVPAALVIPAVLVVAMLLVWAAGVAIPEGPVPLYIIPVLGVSFLLAAAAEQLGWMGVAYEPLVARLGRNGATTVLGLVWATWHLPFWAVTFPGPIAVLAQVITVVALRFVLVWFYERLGRSVFIAIVVHAGFNTGLAAVPVYGMAEPLGMWVVAGLMVVLAGLLWFRLPKQA